MTMTNASVVLSQPKPAAGAAQLTLCRLFVGVYRDTGGRYTARFVDDKGKFHLVGPFQNEVEAAVAHDRIAIAYYGSNARVNLPPAFYPVEREFLRQCGNNMVVDIVSNGTYEEKYAVFLRRVYLSHDSAFFQFLFDFFINRRNEIGQEALGAGGEVLINKFVEMYRNKATDAEWLAWFYGEFKKYVTMQRQQQQQQQQQQDAMQKHLQFATQQQPAMQKQLQSVNTMQK